MSCPVSMPGVQAPPRCLESKGTQNGGSQPSAEPCCAVLCCAGGRMLPGAAGETQGSSWWHTGPASPKLVGGPQHWASQAANIC